MRFHQNDDRRRHHWVSASIRIQHVLVVVGCAFRHLVVVVGCWCRRRHIARDHPAQSGQVASRTRCDGNIPSGRSGNVLLGQGGVRRCQYAASARFRIQRLLLVLRSRCERRALSLRPNGECHRCCMRCRVRLASARWRTRLTHCRCGRRAVATSTLAGHSGSVLTRGGAAATMRSSSGAETRTAVPCPSEGAAPPRAALAGSQGSTLEGRGNGHGRTGMPALAYTVVPGAR